MTASKRTPPTAEPRKSRIPTFKSIQEEAAWWEAHDVTDYLDELTLVKLVFKPRSAPRPVVIPLDPDGFTALETKARERGLTPTALAKEWIEERLRSA